MDDECEDADEAVIRALLAKHGYDPDLPARGLAGLPGEVISGHGFDEAGKLVPMRLRNHVCALEGFVIDGHSDPDLTGGCIYCGKDMP